MNILCIDLGNTNVHYGIVDKKEVSHPGSFSTKQFKDAPHFLTEFHHLLREGNFEAISFCSVVPDLNSAITTLLKALNKPIFQLSYTSNKGIKLSYPKPSEVGQDRIANAIAARAYYSVPAIIIDMGTAITFDIVTDQGYEGGVIAPGLRLMTQYLNEQTALLPELSAADLITPTKGFGTSTVQAMQLGMSIGFSGMVEALLKHISNALVAKGYDAPIVLTTGGSIANLTQNWKNKTEFVEYLTLLGLAVAYDCSTKERCSLKNSNCEI